MRVVIDGQALQTGSAGVYARALLQPPGRDWTLLEAGHLPPAPSVGLRHLTFQAPRPVTPFDLRDGRVNAGYYGDWLLAHGAAAVVILNYFDPQTVVPHFAGPRPHVVGVLSDLSEFQSATKRRRWCCARFRALLDADVLLVSTAGVERRLRGLVPEVSARIIVSNNLEEALAGAARVPAEPRGCKRIAWVSPLPPAASGIADYSADLLPSLAQHYEIDLVIDPRQRALDPTLPARHRTLTGPEAVQRHLARPYDLFVYHVGNSSYHVYLLEMLRRFRGLVVLHDYFLGGLALAARQVRQWPATAEEELEFEGETHLLDWKRKGLISDAALRQLVPENTRFLGLADAVLVHSAWTWQRVRRLVEVPVARVRHLMAPVPAVSTVVRRRELGLPPDAFVVCSLGHHGHTKRMQSLLRAVAAVREPLRSRVLIAIVGPMAPADVAPLRRLAANLGLADRLHLTGFVSMDAFYAYIQASDVCVQLRYPTNGETSGSVLRALAAGAAVVTSDQGPMAELPDDAVCKVRTPQFEGTDLTALLEELAADPARTASGTAAAGRRYVGAR